MGEKATIRQGWTGGEFRVQGSEERFCSVQLTWRRDGTLLWPGQGYGFLLAAATALGWAGV